MITENLSLHDKTFIFSNRVKAGELLASFLKDEKIDLLLAIPNGGVPIAYSLIQNLIIHEFNLLLVRKIQVPWSTESGFGALTPDDQIILNNDMISYFQIEKSRIDKQIQAARSVIKERQELYKLNPFDPKNKNILLTDDGIASGFSMIAGSTWLKKQGAKKIIISVPTAPLSSIKKIEERNVADDIICLNIREIYPFAVAEAYIDWYDVPETEVILLMNEIKTFLKN